MKGNNVIFFRCSKSSRQKGTKEALLIQIFNNLEKLHDL